MSNKQLFKDANSYDFENFVKMVSDLYNQNRVTGDVQSEDKLNATKINLQRMNRICKTHKFSPELVDMITEITDFQDWYVIAEGWCGDASQNLPIIAKLTSLSPYINLK